MSGSRSTLVQGAPAGAGRAWDVRYPDYGVSLVDNSSPGSGATSRGGPSSTAGFTGSASGTGTVRLKNNEPGVGSGTAVGNNGACAIQYLTPLIADLAKTQGPGIQGQWGQLAAGVVSDPFERVYRFLAFAAFEPLAGAIPAGADLGLELLPGNVASMNGGANRPGVMFGPTDANKIGLRTRQAFAGAYATDQEFTLAQLGLASYNQWMLWELRVILGDANGPAQLKAFLNGKQFGNTVLWGGALLPTHISAGGGFYGVFPYFINSAAQANLSAYVQWLRLVRTPDESNL